MQDQEVEKKKGPVILLLVIVAYIAVVAMVAIYMKSNEGVQPSKDALVTAEQVSDTEKQQVAVDKNEIDTQLPVVEETIKSIAQESSVEKIEDDFDEIYSKYEGHTIADVPAKSKNETVTESVQPDDESDVLNASDLFHEVEEEKGFFEAICDWFASLFGGKKSEVKEESVKSDKELLLTERSGEIKEMETLFTSYTEGNGVTYIDHVNKPDILETNGFYIYIGVAPNNFTFHRTIIRYSGAAEIGLKSILIQGTTSDRAMIVDATSEVSQKRYTTQFCEWVDLPPTQENNDLLNTIVTSEHVKITFMGTLKNVEWLVPEKDMITLRESVYFYNLLKEKEQLLK